MLTKGKSAISLKFGVAAKILCIVGVVLALLVAVAATASFQMMKIGDEIVEIAEQDIPLTEALTNITVHQLEQAINFERSLRYGEEMEHSDRAGEHFDESVHHFEELSTQVDGEIVAGTALAETAILHAGTPEAKAEFEHVHESLIAIGAAHKAFEGHALEAIELLANGEIEEAIELAESVEVEVEKLDHQLEALLTEIGTFTHHSASAAEEHEKSALSLMVIMAAISLAIGVASTLFFVRRLISKPLSEVVLALEALTKGDTSITVDVRSDDEIGAVAKAMEVFRENTIKMQEMEKEREESERRAEEEKRRAMQGPRQLLRRQRQERRPESWLIGVADALEGAEHGGHGGRDGPPVDQRRGRLRTGHDQRPDGLRCGRRAHEFDQRDQPPGCRFRRYREGSGRRGQQDERIGTKPVRGRIKDRRCGVRP